jgi:hypothetical protein
LLNISIMMPNGGKRQRAEDNKLCRQHRIVD